MTEPPLNRAELARDFALSLAGLDAAWGAAAINRGLNYTSHGADVLAMKAALHADALLAELAKSPEQLKAGRDAARAASA